MIAEWMSILPQFILAMGGLAILCAGAFWRGRPPMLLFGLAILSAMASGLSGFVPLGVGASFMGMVDTGGYSRFFLVLIAAITVLTLLFVYRYAERRKFSGDEFYGIILFASLGMILVASSIHWVTFFLGLEMLSLALYVLIAARRNHPASGEAAIKYLIMGSVASGFLTFGIALLYAMTGKMNIAQSLGPGFLTDRNAGLLLALGLIMVGIGFKASLAPFHLWTPDVYQGAPAPVTAFLSTGSKVAIFAALLRISINTVDTAWSHVIPVIWIIAALTMVVGNISALTQRSVKRLLAYSSIAQMGYLVMALTAVRQSGAQAIMFYTAVYALMDLGAFGTIGLLSDGDEDRDQLTDYEGLGYSRPWNAALLAVCLLSLAGLPPTAGFIGKFVLFQATLQAGYLVLAVIGILTAIVSVFFYLRVITTMYMRPGTEGETAALDPFGAISSWCVLVLILALGILPSPLLTYINKVLALFAA